MRKALFTTIVFVAVGTFGCLEGPMGSQGTDGTNGAQGEQGVAGTDGADGATGATGSDGAQGEQGVAGTDGADGATGATGSDGADGPGTRIVLTGILDSHGSASRLLPAEAGTITDIPVIAVYLSDDGVDWRIVSATDWWQPIDEPYTAMELVVKDLSGQLLVTISNDTDSWSEWFYKIAVIY
jgi:hypothetical protein